MNLTIAQFIIILIMLHNVVFNKPLKPVAGGIWVKTFLKLTRTASVSRFLTVWDTKYQVITVCLMSGGSSSTLQDVRVGLKLTESTWG